MASGSSWRVNGDGFNDFEWLRDLRAFGGSQARTRARRLINNWLHQNDRWTMKGWQPDIMAKRLANLVFCYDWYGSSADENFQGNLGRQFVYKPAVLPLTGDGCVIVMPKLKPCAA